MSWFEGMQKIVMNDCVLKFINEGKESEGMLLMFMEAIVARLEQHGPLLDLPHALTAMN